jgi:Tol biopolymer transport system component
MSKRAACWAIAAVTTLAPGVRCAGPEADPKAAAALAREVKDRGWIAYSACYDENGKLIVSNNLGGDSHGGDFFAAEGKPRDFKRCQWDLFLMRPDGSGRRNITRTRQYNELAPRFSPNGRRLLYYRGPPEQAIADNNGYGTHELVVADADGTGPTVFGRGYNWASWGPGSDRIACLNAEGIVFVDVATKKVVSRLKRKGFFQQLNWSPDGKRLCATANGLGKYWNVASMDVATGAVSVIGESELYNCTPFWLPDSRHVSYARGIAEGERDGRAWLEVADYEGKDHRVIYAEKGRHVYGSRVSPDGKYVVFTRSVADLGEAGGAGVEVALMRLEDAPIIVGFSDEERARRGLPAPNPKKGPVLHLGLGWEPHWTFAEIRTPEAKGR